MENADSKSEILETKVKDSRNKEMKVLVMGMGRAGTTGNECSSTLPQANFQGLMYLPFSSSFRIPADGLQTV